MLNMGDAPEESPILRNWLFALIGGYVDTLAKLGPCYCVSTSPLNASPLSRCAKGHYDFFSVRSAFEEHLATGEDHTLDDNRAIDE